MKALSLTQPWPDCVIHLDKRIENREKWKGCSYRGPVLLHAALGLGSRAAVSVRLATMRAAGVSDEWLAERFESRWLRASEGTRFWTPRSTLRLGGIVGRAEIVDVIDPKDVAATCCVGDAFDAWIDRGGDPGQRRWWFGGFALVLDKVEALPFVPWKGALGLFEVPDDYATRAA